MRKKYIVQWGNSAWKYWWTEKEFRWGWRAKRYALKMLARNSNVSPWRVIRIEKNDKTIIFEGSINRKWRNITGNLEDFSEKDIEKYYKAPIIIDGRTGKKREIK